MTLFPTLPFGRQSRSASQSLLATIRSLLMQHRRTKPDPPRARLRSLDVIPLAFNLPRSACIRDITNTILPDSPLQCWNSLSLSCTFTLTLLDQLLKFFADTSSSSHKKIPPLLTWNPSSLATIHNQPSPKLNHILKYSRTHICLLQETQWTSVQFKHIHLSAPFTDLTHSESIPNLSSGVATFLPRPFYSQQHKIVSPGFILSTTTLIQGLSCEIINVYLRPFGAPHLFLPSPLNMMPSG